MGEFKLSHSLVVVNVGGSRIKSSGMSSSVSRNYVECLVNEWMCEWMNGRRMADKCVCVFVLNAYCCSRKLCVWVLLLLSFSPSLSRSECVYVLVSNSSLLIARANTHSHAAHLRLNARKRDFHSTFRKSVLYSKQVFHNIYINDIREFWSLMSKYDGHKFSCFGYIFSRLLRPLRLLLLLIRFLRVSCVVLGSFFVFLLLVGRKFLSFCTRCFLSAFCTS